MVTNISSGVVRVTWTRPALPNGILLTYLIIYGTAKNERQTVEYNGKEVSYLFISTFINSLVLQTQIYDITGLAPYQMVTVHVFATNGAETSGSSNTVTGFSSEEGVYSFETKS